MAHEMTLGSLFDYSQLASGSWLLAAGKSKSKSKSKSKKLTTEDTKATQRIQSKSKTKKAEPRRSQSKHEASNSAAIVARACLL
jgi:hypothetical protein